MDTKQKFYRVNKRCVRSNGVIGYIRKKDIITGKKFYQPTIGSKMLCKQFKKASFATLYAAKVIERYQSLLRYQEYLESKKHIEKEIADEL